MLFTIAAPAAAIAVAIRSLTMGADAKRRIDAIGALSRLGTAIPQILFERRALRFVIGLPAER